MDKGRFVWLLLLIVSVILAAFLIFIYASRFIRAHHQKREKKLSEVKDTRFTLSKVGLTNKDGANDP